MIYLKYEFTDKETWDSVRATLYTQIEEGEVLISQINAIHEIGFICLAKDDEGECIDLSTKYAVDMLLNEPVMVLDEYVVYPKPCGIHLFGGQEALYLKSYCEANPESEYCKIKETEL